MRNVKKKGLLSLKVLVFLNCIPVICLNAQTTELPLRSGNTAVFRKQLYCFGMQNKKAKSYLSVYRLNASLAPVDSISLELNSEATAEQGQCWSDSLHGLLNIYVPEGKNKGFSIFRLNSAFEVVEQAKAVEAGRLQTLSGFNNELYYDGNTVYMIQSKGDSSRRQFYLNKFRLKEDLKTFEYDPLWQFPFEREHIRYAKVIYSNREVVFVYVMIGAGEKSGQWVLKLNARNGYLLRGSKLNDKSEEQCYFYGCCRYNPGDKSLILLGQKFQNSQLHPVSGLPAASSATASLLYLIELDSLGEKKNKQELRWLIKSAKSPATKTKESYLFQFSPLLENAAGQYSVNADVYKCIQGKTCFVFVNSLGFSFAREEERLIPSKTTVSGQAQIETYLLSNDKLDMNGKLCADSGVTFTRLLYKTPSLPVKLHYNLDSLNRAYWLLGKSLIKKESLQFHILKPGKQGYELKLIEEIDKAKQPRFCLPDERRLVLGRQESEQIYRLKQVRIP